MRFSVRVNNDLPLPEYVLLAQAAERAGFDQFWVSNDLFLRSAPVILAAIATATQHLGIGVGILNPYTIHPAELAMLAATMDELSGNRFHLGLAAGAAEFLRWVGIPQERPLSAVEETIRAVRDLLAGKRAPIQGRFLRWTEKAYLRFPAPRVTPIYLGAMSPKMLRLAGRLADGALPLLFPPEAYSEVRAHIEEGMAAREPTLGDLDLVACVWVSVAEDPEEARRALAEKIAYYGPALSSTILRRLKLTRDDLAPIERAMTRERDLEKALRLVDDRMLRIGIVGRPRDVIARLEPLVEAGVRHLSFGPPLGPDPLVAVDLLGREVLPYFRRRTGGHRAAGRAGRVTRLARPARSTRSPRTRTRTIPPRADAWNPTSSALPSRCRQNGPRQQWAEPVTGSSSTPTRGAKKRDTKSYPASSARAVTMTPRHGTLPRSAISGRSARTAASDSSSIR